MKHLLLVGIFAAVSLCAADQIPLSELARQATAADPHVADAAVAALRQAGPTGLETLFAQYSAEIDAHRRNPNATAEQWTRIAAALDTVAKQKDAYTARLYWYTNIDDAKAAAKASGKPILSLRLLGNLDEEYSCANSRFFRSALYANEEVSRALRDGFILHWKSVRPVPKITIDFGDGRVLTRTITGNSVHYVLNADGLVIDALPGLYGPKAFLAALHQATAAELAAHANPDALRQYHVSRQGELTTAWNQDYRTVQGGSAPVAFQAPPVMLEGSAPTALAAAPLALSKSDGEMPILKAILPKEASPDSVTDEAVWKKIAALHIDESRLDASSQALVVSKNPNAFAAGRITMAKRVVENPVLRVIRNFEDNIAEDTVRNEYQMHRRIHEWLANPKTTRQVDVLNERVYAELFLTPSSDPWLGLAPEKCYSALPNDGKSVTLK